MSYPSIEAYEISHFIDSSYNLCARLGTDAKQIISQNADKIDMNKINEPSILHACDEFKKYISDQGIDFNIDDFSSTNISIFNREENYYEEKNTYFLFSVMSYILLDLGIIQD